MIILNEKVIARRDDEGYILFDLTNGTMTEINLTGYYIWQCLQAGLDEESIVAKFREKSPQTPVDELQNGVHRFLGMLAGKGYISGFAGEKIPPAYGEGKKSLDNKAIYELNSMRRVFVPGDALIFEEIPFESFRPGDITAFYPDGTEKTGIVHRVISRTAESLTTMGDNNPAPDNWKVTPAYSPKLVVSRIRPDGAVFPVLRGADGVKQFRINRLRYWSCRVFLKLARTFQPLMFWRKEFTGCYEFDKTIQYYYDRRIVAKSENGYLEYFPVWNILRYKLPKEK